MVYDIKNKVALITGGASGIGFQYAKELLKKQVKGVTIADINPVMGKKSVEALGSEFGPNKVLFVKTDVADLNQFEDAFLETIKKFNHIDILINNAGVANEVAWEDAISINFKGTVHGIQLGLEKYLPKYKQGEEAIILNVSSLCGLQGYGLVPVYCGTKHAILGLVKAWGIPEYYKNTKVRVFAICPGVTMTTLVTDLKTKENNPLNLSDTIAQEAVQQPEFVAHEAVKLLGLAKNGSIWVIEGGELVYEYIFPPRRTIPRTEQI